MDNTEKRFPSATPSGFFLYGFALATAVLVVLVPSGTGWSTKPIMPTDGEYLEGYGIDPNDIAEVRRQAVESPITVVRIYAIRHLGTTRNADAAQFLDDPKLSVRTEVADFLADQGRTDGLERMREDYSNLEPWGQTQDPDTLRRYVIKGTLKLSDALEVGAVLAKMNDYRALELGLIAVRDAQLPAKRYRAIDVLEHFLRTADEHEFAPERKKAEEALLQCAAEEKDKAVLTTLVAGMGRLGGPLAERVLTALRDGDADKVSRMAAGRTLQKLRGEYTPGPIVITPIIPDATR
jgi:hypothetical protein